MAVSRLSTALERLAGDLQISLGEDGLMVNEPLSRHTALRIGGPADLLTVATNLEQLRRSVTLAWEHGVPCRVLGAGSNILVSDVGVRGLVVLNRARAITFPSPRDQGSQGPQATVKAESGASFSTLARRCVTRGLAGLEWAATIPGTVGGAVIGNAGAWGGDVASALVGARILETNGSMVEWPVERFGYAYRASRLKQDSSPDARRAVVLDAEFALYQGEQRVLEAQVAKMVSERKSRQPAGASCGSVFRNPPGDYAGRLIEAAGLKGVSRGGAEISPVHANFIVNRGGASAVDVKALIELAQEKVRAQSGIMLELEIQLIGPWSRQGAELTASYEEQQGEAG